MLSHWKHVLHIPADYPHQELKAYKYEGNDESKLNYLNDKNKQWAMKFTEDEFFMIKVTTGEKENDK